MKKRLSALCLVLILLLGLLAGCSSSTSDSGSSSSSSDSDTAEETTEAEETEEEEAVTTEAETAEAETAEEAVEAEETAEETVSYDFTEDNANYDFTGFKEMLTTLTTTLPITTEDVTLTMFLGFESSYLNYIEGGRLEDHQIWSWLEENTGINLELTYVDTTNATDQFNLIIASGDYPDLLPAGTYSSGVEAAYEDEVFLNLTDYLEENMPNYWTIINSDQNLLEEVQDGGMFLAVYPVKDQSANPTGTGTFIRMDWLEELGMDVPETYDELTEVLRAFKTEMGASEPMSLFNTVSMSNGLLMGGFGSLAELSSENMSSGGLNAYYQVDGTVVYGATQDGTRKFLSWLNELYDEDLIDFDNMLARETDPFSELNATEAADGSTGYIFSNQPFGGNYSTMAATQYGDEDCNWWPVQDVAEEAGQTIPFYEEQVMTDSYATALAVSTQCENVEIALQFLDYGYSYEGSLLYNFGFQIGSGHDLETWDYNEEGEPEFDAAALLSVADATAIASAVVCTKDLAGVVYDTRLSFEYDERELSCMDAWSTNKNASNILGSAVSFTADEGTEAAAIYSDIITYVSTSVLQFINGTLDINDDAAWENYVETIESMNLDGLTEIVQQAYDRAYAE